MNLVAGRNPPSCALTLPSEADGAARGDRWALLRGKVYVEGTTIKILKRETPSTRGVTLVSRVPVPRAVGEESVGVENAVGRLQGLRGTLSEGRMMACSSPLSYLP